MSFINVDSIIAHHIFYFRNYSGSGRLDSKYILHLQYVIAVSVSGINSWSAHHS